MMHTRTVLLVALALVAVPALPAVQGLPTSAGVATQKLAPAELGEFDRFGHDIAVDGDRAAISIADNEGIGGIAIYEKAQTGWEKTDWIDPPAVLPEDPRLGSSLVLQGDTLLAGASGVDDGGIATGAALLFTYDDENWNVEEQFRPPNPEALNAFGREVAMDGDTIAISEPEADPDENYDRDGRIHLYERVNDAFVHQETLTPPSDDDGERLGLAMELEGDTLVASGPDDNTANGGTGAVFVYEDGKEGWTQTARLTAPAEDGAEQLGQSLDLDGDALVVGAPGPQVTICCGVTPPTPPGQAHVFAVKDGEWSHQARLSPLTDQVPGAGFGTGVALDGDTAHVGAPNAPYDMNVGIVHTFSSTDNGWTETGLSLAQDPDQADRFGDTLATDGGDLLVAEPGDEAQGFHAGAVHVVTDPVATLPLE